MIAYNSTEPPDYPLEKVTMPMVIFQGTNDFCADPLVSFLYMFLYYILISGWKINFFPIFKDVELLVERLPNVVDRFMRPVNHIDFGYNRNMRSLVYNKIVELFQNSENKTSRIPKWK